MNKATRPHGGSIGSSAAASYTREWPYRIFWLGSITIAINDLVSKSAHITSSAIGIDSIWIRFGILFAGRFTLLTGLGVLYAVYSSYSGVAFRDDRIGFGKAGGRDIGLWSAVVSWFACIFTFAFAIPQNPLSGINRTLGVVLAHMVLQLVLALMIAHIAWSQKFGKPHGVGMKLLKILILNTDHLDEVTGAPSDSTNDRSYAAFERSETEKNRCLVAWYQKGIPKALGMTIEELRRFPTDAARGFSVDLLVGRLGVEKAADFCVDCGLIAYEENEFVAAERWQRHALSLADQVKAEKTRAFAYHELGMVAAARGRYLEAEKFYRRSLAIKKLEESAVTLSQLGIALSEQGRYEDAARNFLESARLAQIGMDYEELKTVRVNFRVNVRNSPAHLQPTLRLIWKNAKLGQL